MSDQPPRYQSAPTSDPTALTTSQLIRELTALKESIETRIKGLERVYDVQFSAIEKSQVALTAASTTAVNAALSAQKEMAQATQEFVAESARKSESGFRSAITSLETLLNSTKEQLAAQITDLRSRLDRSEGSNHGAQSGRLESHMTLGSIFGVVGGVVGIISLLSVLVFGSENLITKSVQPSPPAAAARP